MAIRFCNFRSPICTASKSDMVIGFSRVDWLCLGFSIVCSAIPWLRILKGRYLSGRVDLMTNYKMKKDFVESTHRREMKSHHENQLGRGDDARQVLFRSWPLRRPTGLSTVRVMAAMMIRPTVMCTTWSFIRARENLVRCQR
jgi:hypothetical protein